MIMSVTCSSSAGTIIYVNANATGANNGTSWTDAYTCLQSALAAAVSNDQIWAAAGTYKPTPGSDRTVSFQLKTGVAIYGGFPDSGNPVWSDRNWQTQITTLSGDIGTAANASDNSYNVVKAISTDATAILDGFIITDGNANQNDSSIAAGSAGGGLYNDHGNPILRNCIIRNNTAWLAGGGICNKNGSPFIIHCTFINNQVVNGSGGAMLNYGNAPAIIGCVFLGNSVSSYGGGVYDVMAQSRYINCSFFGNSTLLSGGGIYSLYCNNSVTNTVFSGNTADACGGAVVTQDSSTVITNCSFSGNFAPQGGGVANVYSLQNAPTLANCILWNNSVGEIYVEQSQSPVITYSIVKGIGPGYGNISSDPCFVDVNGPDDIIGTADDNLRLMRGSPAVDAGNNTSVPQDGFDLNGNGNIIEPLPWDRDNNPRFRDDLMKANTGYAGSTGLPIVDMGAYEWHHPCDIYVDGHINLRDYAILAAHWSETACGYCFGADLTGDGNVNLADLVIFVSHWAEINP